MQQLSAIDSSFLYTESSHAPQHIAILSIYDPSTAPDGRVSFDEIVANTARRLHLARTFRQKLVRVPLDLDHPYWVEDPDFDVEFHVRQTALAKPGDWRQLWLQTARSAARALDSSRPLWELEVIQGLDTVQGLPDDSFAVLLKVHHAAVDGLSGIEILNALHDPTAATEPEVAETRWEPEDDPSTPQLLRRAGINTAKKPVQLAGALVRALPRMRRVAQGVKSEELSRPREAPVTRFNRTVSAHRSFDGRLFSLAHVKRVKAAVPGTTVNDVALTIVGGALRAYLTAKNELPSDSLLALAPISVRNEAEQGQAGNQVAAMIVSLGTDHADPLDRLAAVSQATDSSKELTNAVGARTLTDMSAAVPGALFGLASRASSRVATNPKRLRYNTVVSNVPGPPAPLYCCGARMTGIYGMGPLQDGQGLFHFISSYCGEFTISTLACQEMMPDAVFYGDCLTESFKALRAAVQ
jgi:diacylglycerol O-acyltransferase / wax synthase